jgi:hypothetical protein
MPRLLSGSTLRRGGSGEFLDLRGAMPQLPPSETTATGFTLVTDSLYRTTYRSSLGFIEIKTATMYSSLPEGTIRILATGTSFLATNTESGTLVVKGGIGVGGNMNIAQDIVVNDLTIGKGLEGYNNIVFQGTATARANDFNVGQQSITIGYDSLTGIETSFRNIAIGSSALSSGTDLRLSIAIGDNALKNVGVPNFISVATINDIDRYLSSTISSVLQQNPMRIIANNHGLLNGSQIYVTGVDGITTSSIATGVYSLINEQPLYVNAIDINTLEAYYDQALTVPVNSTNASAYVTGGTVYSPVIITVNTPHQLVSGSYVHIDGIVGTTQLNNDDFYVRQLSANQFSLFLDPIFKEPVDGTPFGSYVSGGEVQIRPQRDANIGYGHSAGENLIDGTNNVLLGNNSAQNLNTGSNNIIIGNNKAFDLFTGSGIISIGGDNIVNGKNNQVNIGSIFYYDGSTTSTIRSITRILSYEQSVSTNTGALQTLGGIGINGNGYFGGMLQVLGTQTSTITNDLSVLGNTTIKKSLTVDGSDNINLVPNGATVYIQPDLGGSVVIRADSPGTINNISIGATDAESGRFTTVQVINTTNSTSTVTGALVVAGGVGIGGNVYSNSGNADENYLLHTPRISVSAGVPPTDPKVGDFWIDSAVPAYLQYIKDGTNKFWIQIGSV